MEEGITVSSIEDTVCTDYQNCHSGCGAGYWQKPISDFIESIHDTLAFANRAQFAVTTAQSRLLSFLQPEFPATGCDLYKSQISLESGEDSGKIPMSVRTVTIIMYIYLYYIYLFFISCVHKIRQDAENFFRKS